MEFQSPPRMHRTLTWLQNKIGYCLTLSGISNRCMSYIWTYTLLIECFAELVDFKPSKSLGSADILGCGLLWVLWNGKFLCF